MSRFDRIDTSRLSPQSRWALEHLLLPKVDQDLENSQLAESTGLTTRMVKKYLDTLNAEVRAQQEGATIPALGSQGLEALKEQIRLHGLIYPIVVDERTGRDLDGGSRRRACEELGIRPRTTKVQTRDEEHARALSLSLNLARRHLDARRLRGIAADEIIRDPSRSDRAIAELLGLSYMTVGRARKELLKLGLVSHSDTRKGRDGVVQPVAAAIAAAVERELSSTDVRLEEIRDELAALGLEADLERAHGRADELLCEALRVLGAGEISDAFEALDKWYA